MFRDGTCQFVDTSYLNLNIRLSDAGKGTYTFVEVF